MEPSGGKFNLDTLIRSFEECLDKTCGEGGLDLKNYLQGFGEICHFIGLLGTVFSFVNLNYRPKLSGLEKKLASADGRFYSTVESILEFEVSRQLVGPRATHSSHSASDNLLQLQRSLQFFYIMLEKIRDIDPREKIGPYAKKAYEESLSTFHSWLIQKTINAVFHLLPTKEGLIKMVSEVTQEQPSQIEPKIYHVISILKDVHQQAQILFEKHDLLKLPWH